MDTEIITQTAPVSEHNDSSFHQVDTKSEVHTTTTMIPEVQTSTTAKPEVETTPKSFEAGEPVSFEEYRACTELTFEWADSYDRKDWAALASILAPTLRINYASVNDYRNDALPAADFVAMTSSPGFLGDLNLDTQHLMGAHKLRKTSPEVIEGKWQIRAGHQRYRTGDYVKGIDATATTKRGERPVLLTGHSHATITLTYQKVNEEWKWAGITTDIRWNETGFDKMFMGFEAGKAP